MSADSFASKHRADFDQFRRGWRVGFVKPAIGFFVILALWGLFCSYTLTDSDLERLDFHREQLLALGDPQSAGVVAAYDGSVRWLQRRGIAAEVRAYQKFSSMVFYSMVEQAGKDSMFSRLYASIHAPALRMWFLVAACWRIWLLTVLAAAYLAVRAVRPYEGSDFLGQTGNGRLFYSGIRAGLDKLTPTGTPDRQVRGLACPKALPLESARNLPLGKLLEQYGIDTDTNLELAAIVLAHPDCPAYVAEYGREHLLEERFSGISLPDNTGMLLQSVAALFGGLSSDVPPSELQLLTNNEQFDPADPELLPVIRTEGDQIDPLQNIRELQQGLFRVLTPELREALSRVSLTDISTTLLAYEAGKVMAYSREGGRWIRKTNFPQLTARAVLHSTQAFEREYSFDSRKLIRRALVYGWRRSVYAPVCLPIDLNRRTHALRQWVEVLMAVPHELEAVVDEVELYGLCSKLHYRWCKEFYEAILSTDIVDVSFASERGLIFMPLGRAARLIREFVDDATIVRLRELLARVHQRQSRQEADPDGAVIPDYVRVVKPLSEKEIRQLAAEHKLEKNDVRAWSAFRVVLNSYSWLARRVANSAVPASAVVYATLRVSGGSAEQNELGLVGRTGMVTMRAFRVADQFGSRWRQRFVEIDSAAIGTSQQEYEQLLLGIDVLYEEELRNAVGG